MKKTVSIGIPAYNEDGNIGHLINSLLNQKGDNFILKEIIVVSDASTDKTVEVVKSISDKRVIVNENKERIGQALSQNLILEQFTGDILVLLNADVLPVDEYFIQEMAKPFYRDSQIGIVSSREIPLDPQIFFEKIIHYSFILKTQIFEQKDRAQNMYLCHGSNRAFSKEFVKQMKWPIAIGEDVYSYLQCLKKGYIFSYITTTGVLLKLPNNFKDHLRQSARYVVSEKIMLDYFQKDSIKQEYKIPTKILLKTVTPSIFKHPVLFSCYFLIFLATRIYPKKNRFGNSKWEISKSSKILIKKEAFGINIDGEVSQKMKIAILDMDNLKNQHWKGGQARVTRQIGKRLVQKGHEVIVFCSKYPAWKDYTEDGIIYKHIGLVSKNPQLTNFVFLLTLPFIVRKIKADIILENFTAPITTCFSPLFTKIPVMFTTPFLNPWEMEKRYKLPFTKIMKFGLKFYKYGIPLTSEQENVIKKINPHIKTRIIGNAVESNYFTHPTEEKNYILFFGRLDIKPKGLDILLKAFSLVCGQISENLYIMGSSTEASIASLKQMISSYNIDSRVKLLGHLEGAEKEQYIAKSKFIVAPSQFEGQSLSMIESMAFGKAVVCFDISGSKWAKDNCFRVKKITPEAFAEEMLRASKNNTERQKTGRNAKVFVKNYNWDESAKSYENFMKEVVKESAELK